eukprot:m.18648 g.18648  ORF g.18648 m.18648 type:complete len:65 (+) comp5758_c0_seq1:489-683(+)
MVQTQAKAARQTSNGTLARLAALFAEHRQSDIVSLLTISHQHRLCATLSPWNVDTSVPFVLSGL